jgi:5-methylthioadenosine/S-adenosylhomocysteine deaminase
MNEYYLESKYIISGSKCEKLIKDGAILVEAGKIIDVGKSEDIKKLILGHDKIERSNHIAIPSFINAHTHLPETLLRGICDNETLMTWLNEFIWPFEMKMSSEDAYYGALLGCLELIETGSSGFIDQYFYAESIERAAKEANIRALLCPSVFDNTPESGSLENTWKHVSNLVKRKTNSSNSLIKYGIGPHAPYTVPEEYLLQIAEVASKLNIPIHIHLNETKQEIKDAKEQFKMSPIQHVNSLGLTDLRILGAHCVHTNDQDMKIMQSSDFTVLHNPQSNLKMANGIAPIYKYLNLGIDVAIGTDGNASNNDLGMLEEISTAALLQKYLANDPKVINNSEILTVGTIQGMKALGEPSSGIAKDSVADITLLSYERSHSWPQNDPLSNVVYSSLSSDVSDLFVNGNLVYENRQHKTLDKNEIIEKCTRISERILSEMGK